MKKQILQTIKIKSREFKMPENNSDFFIYFFEALKNATTNIQEHYFQLHVAGDDNLKYKERVYCYELYHQLRCALGYGFPYTLDGEYDKSGHSKIVGNKKPDLIVHIPGTMERNLVIIEVKSTDAENNEIKEDIEKFQTFFNANYFKAIMLIYGNNESIIKYAREQIDSLQDHKECILLLWHKEPGSKAEEYHALIQ